MALLSEAVVAALKAVGEPTRHRIVMLLREGELNVKDLTRVLGQSQPRISRHLKLLVEAGVIERTRDGAWVYFQLVNAGEVGALVETIAALTDRDDLRLKRDRERAEAIKREREAEAQAYFAEHAAEWDRIRSLHVPEARVEDMIRRKLGRGPFKALLDLGTGTGRVLEILADRYQRGIGIDINHTMLAYARARLQQKGIEHAQVRHGDLYHLSLPDSAVDAVIMHQVLHFLSDPALALHEAARVLEPGGRLVIVDFAPHDLEFLRTEHAHERLGFPETLVAQWLKDSGLDLLSLDRLAKEKAQNRTTLEVLIWTAAKAGRPALVGARGAKMEAIG